MDYFYDAMEAAACLGLPPMDTADGWSDETLLKCADQLENIVGYLNLVSLDI